MNLEKDDLGRINDVITDEYGNETVIEMNREVITLRGVVAGEYQVMVHVFSRKFDPVSEAFIDHPVKYNVEVIKINPYDVVYRQEGLYTTRGTEISVVRFTVDANADYISYNNLESDFINGVETGRGGYVQQTADGMGEER